MQACSRLLFPALFGVVVAVAWSPAPAMGQDCCVPHGTPSCSDFFVSSCVCAGDFWCCVMEWDSLCVQEVEEFGCGTCGGGNNGGPGDCCAPHGYASCSNYSISACVCNNDSYCCDYEWDSICANEVEGLGCGSCSGGCLPNCSGKQCGSDGCGGICGNCPNGSNCVNGNCIASCQPKCSGKQCGPDGCNGSCGTCPGGQLCNAQGLCQPNCMPNCSGKQCGPDGCNGQCGTCGFGMFCNNGLCVNSCDPNCAGKQCGSDGCGGDCGMCGGGQFCTAEGICQGMCQPSCSGKQCGPDGCNGQCGNCGFGMFCNPSGLCVTQCEKSCIGKECGDDGCGGSCGSCGQGYACTEGLCKAGCKPACLNRECGPDKCGGSCGSCGFGFLCTVDGFCIAESEADAYTILSEDAWEGSWDEDDASGEPGNGIGYSGYLCPPGQKLWYGKCIPLQQEAGDGDVAGGCSATRSLPHAWPALLCLAIMAAALVLAARRSHSNRT